MLIQRSHIPLVIYYLNTFILQLFFYILKIKNWDNKKVRKNTCKDEATNDSCYDSVETSDFE